MSLKKKLAMALVTTTAGAAIMAAGSFALFTSSATNSGNTFSAGTLAVSDITSGTLSSQEINAANLAPGDTKQMVMTVQNTGSLDEWVKIDSAATTSSETGALFAGTSPLTLTLDSNVVKLTPGATQNFNVTYSLPIGADNSYQGASGTFSVKVDAVQARNNTNATNDGPTSWN